MRVPRKYDDTYLECRSLMHAWQPSSNRPLLYRQGNTNFFEECLECTRCGMLRYDTWVGSTLWARRYVAPEGYYVPGATRATRRNLRALRVNRRRKQAMRVPAPNKRQR